MGNDNTIDPAAMLKLKLAMGVIDKAENALKAAMKANNPVKVREACRIQVAAHKKFEIAFKEL
jgi:hypothetical protein